MVEVDPDVNAFVFCYDHSRYIPVEYHVTFFDSEKATRSWLTANSLKPYVANKIKREMLGKVDNKRLMESVNQAQECDRLPLVERLRTYGFTVRYEGKIVGPKSPCSKPLLANYCSPKATTVAKPQRDKKVARKPRSKQKETATSSVKDKRVEKIKKDVEMSEKVGLNEAVCQALMPTPEMPTIEDSTAQPALSDEIPSISYSRDESQRVDLEKELDEIESILSQSLLSQSQRSISLSPAPNRNRPISPALFSRDGSQSNRLTGSQSVSSQSQEIRSQTGNSPRKSQAAETPAETLAGKTKTKPLLGKAQVKSQTGTTQAKSLHGKTQNKSLHEKAQDKFLPKTTPAKSLAGKIQNKSLPKTAQAKSLGGKTQAKSHSGKTQAKSQAGKTQAKSQAGKSQAHSLAEETQDTSQTGKPQEESKDENSQSKSATNGSHNKSRSVSPAVTGNKKSVKKGFKCPAMNVNSKATTDKQTDVKPPTTNGLNLANNSVFTQELSGVTVTQKSAVSQPGLMLSNSSVFTQELSGKDPFTRASNVNLTSEEQQIADSSNMENIEPAKTTGESANAGNNGQVDNASHTQESSGKNPFTTASNLTCDNSHGTKIDLDKSMFTQELSNKPGDEKRSGTKGKKARQAGKLTKDNDDYGSYSEEQQTADSSNMENIEPAKSTGESANAGNDGQVDNANHTQGSSGKNPFTTASSLTCDNLHGTKIDLDKSMFTQELSNKPGDEKRSGTKGKKARQAGKLTKDNDDYGSYSEDSSDSGAETFTRKRKLADVNTIDLSLEP